jgi:predicted Zn finger-like uncharacterized protein
MSLVTRCPRCRTLFRVTPGQLQARSGRVRCGRCMNAFDAYAALAAEAGNVLAAPSLAATDEPALETARAASLAAAPAPAPSTPAAAAPATVTPTATSTPAPAARPYDNEPEPARRLLRQPTAAELWTVGAAGLVLVLLLQVALAYRSELVARSPAVRSAVTAICEHVGCRVPLPQRPELVRIEASDVHMVDAARPQLIQLTATLRSYASYDLAYPALDLVLTNANEHALARRIFRPDEYLDATRDPEAGLPANAEITIALDLDTGNLNPAGFRLDLLAAPAP